MYDETAKEALIGSITYWKKIVKCEVDCTGAKGCPLCNEFLEDNCKGCPIYEDTGLISCEGSPYSIFNKYASGSTFHNVSGRIAVSDQKSKELAEIMLDYLQNLLDNDVVPCVSIGDRFDSYSGNHYILVSNAIMEACLISLDSGGRWTDGVKVKDLHAIPEDFFKQYIAVGRRFTRTFSYHGDKL